MNCVSICQANLTSLLPGDWSIEAVTSLAIDDLL